MHKVVKLFLLFLMVTVSVSAQSQINAKKVLGDISKIGPTSKAWLSAEYADILLYPHTTVYEDKSLAKKVKIKALYNGESIAFLLQWSDASENREDDCCPKSRKDGFAMQFPLNYSDAQKLPYISMGDRDRAVLMSIFEASEKIDESDVDNLYSQKLKESYDTFHSSVSDGSYQGRDFLALGENNLTQIQDDLSAMDMVYKDGRWKATLVRKLKTKNLELKGGAFPISLVIWDGSSANTKGLEFLSAWTGVKLSGERGGYEILSALEEQAKGDIANGKKLVKENCAGCHNFTDSFKAPQYIAPNLSNIGGYSIASYLRESIISPRAVVVEEYNSNLQSDFPWYNKDENGNLISTMPTYEWMDAKSVEDIIAFLRSLKAQSDE